MNEGKVVEHTWGVRRFAFRGKKVDGSEVCDALLNLEECLL